MSDIIADGTVETPNVEDLQARLSKAEAKIIDLKKSSTKETPKVEDTLKVEPTEDTPNFMTREDYQKEEFFKNNTELLDHKDDINEYVSKWYSLEDAKTVVISKDKTIEARKNTENSNFTAWSLDIWKTSFTKEELWNMNQSDYNKTMALIESWKAVKG